MIRAAPLAAGLILAATSATAQGRQCGPTEQVFRALTEQYSEAVIGQAMAASGIVHLFVNTVTGTWTLVVSGAGMTCLIAHGTSWETVDAQLPPNG